MRHKNTVRHNQKGFASMVVALTVVIILALISVGFAQLTRREQQNALNKQLATQATYAAETGINDAYKYIQKNPDHVFNANACNDLPTTATTQRIEPDIDSANGVSYSCLLIDTKPKSLQYTNVEPGQSKKVAFETTTRPDPLKITWESYTHSSFPGATGAGFPQTASWNWPAVLEFTITPFSGGINRNSLVNAAFTTYFYPTSQIGGSNVIGYAPTSFGNILPGSCVKVGENGSRCTAEIRGLPGPGSYLIHFLNLYDTSKVTITAGPAANPVAFSGGQVLIDATGKARDVLKRLQVRVCINEGGCEPLPSFQGQNICKRLETRPGNTDFRSITGGPAGAGDPCYLSPGGVAAVPGIGPGPAIPTPTPVPVQQLRDPELACNAAGVYIGPGLGTDYC